MNMPLYSELSGFRYNFVSKTPVSTFVFGASEFVFGASEFGLSLDKIDRQYKCGMLHFSTEVREPDFVRSNAREL